MLEEGLSIFSSVRDAWSRGWGSHASGKWRRCWVSGTVSSPTHCTTDYKDYIIATGLSSYGIDAERDNIKKVVLVGRLLTQYTFLYPDNQVSSSLILFFR